MAQARHDAFLRGYLQAAKGVSAGKLPATVAPQVQAVMQASQGMPSAGKLPDNIAKLVQQYTQTTEKERYYKFLPSAGKMPDTMPELLKAFVQASQGAPSAGGGQNTKSQVRDAKFQQFVDAASKSPAPSHTTLQRGTPPQDSSLNDPILQKQTQNLAQSQTKGSQQVYFVNNTFNGGEISPEMMGRYDQKGYVAGCQCLRNLVAMPQGGFTKRPGMEYIGDSETGSKLIPFVFSAGESLMLELRPNPQNPTNQSVLFIWHKNGSYYNTGVRLPYGTKHLTSLSYVQSADVIFFAHEDVAPMKLMRYSNTDWRLAEINWKPSIGSPGGIELEPGGDMPEMMTAPALYWYDYVVTAVDENGEEGLPADWTEANHVKTYQLAGYWRIYVRFNQVSGATEYRIYRKENGVFGFVGRVPADEIASGEKGVFEDDGVVPDTEDTPPKYDEPFKGSGNYPRCVFLHQQRLGWASSKNKPLTVWMSASSMYERMLYSLPPEDDDRIEVTLAAAQVNRILWCESDRNGLLVGTEGSEWILKPTEGKAITPSDMGFEPLTNHGSFNISKPAVRAGNGILFIQRGGRVVRSFGYDFSKDSYSAGDVTLLARHIFKSRSIVNWAWQAEPYNIVWCVMSDGTLCGFTYMEDQRVFAWHRHNTIAQYINGKAVYGKVKDVACIPGSDGDDELWLHVSRVDASNVERWHIERLRSFRKDNASDFNQYRDGKYLTIVQGRCIPTLPEGNIQNGSSFLHVRKINAVKARVFNSTPFKVNLDDQASTKALPIPVRSIEYTEDGSSNNWGTFKQQYQEGHYDWAVPIAGGWKENQRVDMIFDNPGPATVLAIVTAVEVADMSGGQQ